MATSVLSNTILTPSGLAIPSVLVIARLRGVVGGFKASTSTEIATAVSTTSDVAGAWTLTLERNADILPLGSYWEIEEQIPAASGGSRLWAVTVGSVNVNLLAALLTAPPPGTTEVQYLTQAAGDARYMPISGNTTQQVSAPSFAANGLTGALAVSRYVGATAGGKPTSGTFAVGDYIIDQGGYIWICTGAGSPGTWASPARGAIGYAQVIANQTGITTEVDLTGLSVSATVGVSRRIQIRARGTFQTNTANTGILSRIKEGAEQLNGQGFLTASVSVGLSWSNEIVLTPTPGVHTYKISMANYVGGTVLLEASATSPAFILVDDIGGI